MTRALISMTLPPDLLSAVDKKRGRTPRSWFIEDVLRKEIYGDGNVTEK